MAARPLTWGLLARAELRELLGRGIHGRTDPKVGYIQKYLPTMLQPEVTAPTCFWNTKNEGKKTIVFNFSPVHTAKWVKFDGDADNTVYVQCCLGSPTGSQSLILVFFFCCCVFLFVFVFLIYFRFNLLFTSPAAFFCLWVCRCLWMSPSGPLSFPHTEPSSVTSKEDTAKANNNKWVK